MILSFINIRKVPREMLKTLGFALGFQHLPRDLANVDELKIMFDPYIVSSDALHCLNFGIIIQMSNFSDVLLLFPFFCVGQFNLLLYQKTLLVT